MAHDSLTPAEMRKIAPKELGMEIQKQRLHLATVQVGVRMKKEQDTAKLQRAKRLLSRMLTVQRQQTNADSQLQPSTSPSTLPAPRSGARPPLQSPPASS